MKILPTTNVNNQRNLQTFKGLCGSKEVDGASHEFGSCISEWFHYYPFADESKSKISAAVRSKTTSWTEEAPGYTSSYSSSVYVMDRLPFTEQEYLNYKALKAEPSELEKIENSLGKTKLYKYANSRIKLFISVLP